MKFIILLLLTGCATVPLDDLYEQRAVCLSQGLECDELDKEIERKEDIRQWKENAIMRCPDGYVAYCDERTHRSCGKRWSKKPIDYDCVRVGALEGLFQ